MKRDTCISCVIFELVLTGCVDNIELFKAKLKEYLINELQPDYTSDIDIELTESTKEL